MIGVRRALCVWRWARISVASRTRRLSSEPPNLAAVASICSQSETHGWSCGLLHGTML